ncbi:MAG TPA: heat-inducible transcriptional repressor HrcA, partial [Acidimicrobiales bacterium]|nr:heat-inducible transcriptional repressor HrcA [Acidimicrobiales bacterium]
TAQPVGSATVSKATSVAVSPATVRAEMVALEREGYLTQPHTSAGRIPTDRGYRFFVDHLAEPGVLDVPARTQVSRFFDHVHGEMEDVLERTSGLLAELTSHAAVVVGPPHTTARILSAQLVTLTPRVVLVVAVLDDGAVEKATLELDDDVGDDAVHAANAIVRERLEGTSLDHARAEPVAGSDTEASTLAARAIEAIAAIAQRREPEQVFIGGGSRLAASFDAVDTVRGVLAILEQQMVVVDLLQDVLASGLSVAIGEEHGYEPLASCAVIVAPLSVESAPGGVVGILGPTRMNYAGAIAAAEVVSSRLTRRLEATRHADAEGSDAHRG